MLKKVVSFVDFNGKEQTKVLYFNLTEPEIVRLAVEFEDKGGLGAYIENLDSKNRPYEVLMLFERLLTLSYGEKTADGLYFDKSPEMLEQFKNSAMYGALFSELLTNGDQAIAFFNQLISRTTLSEVEPQ